MVLLVCWWCWFCWCWCWFCWCCGLVFVLTHLEPATHRCVHGLRVSILAPTPPTSTSSLAPFRHLRRSTTSTSTSVSPAPNATAVRPRSSAPRPRRWYGNCAWLAIGLTPSSLRLAVFCFFGWLFGLVVWWFGGLIGWFNWVVGWLGG